METRSNGLMMEYALYLGGVRRRVVKKAGGDGVGVQKFNRNGVLGKQDNGIPVAASFDLVSALNWLRVVFRQGSQQWWVMKRVGEWKGDGPVAWKVWRLGWEFSHEGTKTPR